MKRTRAATKPRDGKTERPSQRPSRVVPKAPSPAATVLVADDDGALRAALRSILAGDGYDVLEASDGAETLALLGAAADDVGPVPDIVVLDICMPELSGLGILSAMKRLAFPVPTVVMTAFSDRSVDVLAQKLGALRVLHKPFDLEDVRSAVLEAALLPKKRPRRTH
jgi:two-component system, OmpR family, response regulator MprA